MLVLLITLEGWPDHHRYSSLLILPSLNCLCHCWIVLLSSVAFPQTTFNNVWMTGIVLPHKVSILMYAHCLYFVTWALSSDTLTPWNINETTISSSDYTLLANKTWFQPIFVKACAQSKPSIVTRHECRKATPHFRCTMVRLDTHSLMEKWWIFIFIP